MGYQEDAPAPGANNVQVVLEGRETANVEVIRRLVEQVKVGIGRQRFDCGGFLQLAVGHPVRLPQCLLQSETTP